MLNIVLFPYPNRISTQYRDFPGINAQIVFGSTEVPAYILNGSGAAARPLRPRVAAAAIEEEEAEGGGTVCFEGF